MGDLGGDAKNLTTYSTSQNKKKVYMHEGCILKIEGLQARKI